MSEPGNKAAAEKDESESDDDAPRSPGMLSTSPEAAARAETAAAEAHAKAAGPDAPAVSQDRMKELKTKARAEIQQRLTDKRKRRRLLRGNES